jgi:cytidylate kinase
MMVVIDGPAGSGKSSTAKAVAQRTGFHFLDSGAFYRTVTLVYLDSGGSNEMFFDALKTVDVEVRFENETFRVFLNGTDVTSDIRQARVSANVSTVAAMPEARSWVNERLRDFVKTGDFIADGRDLGTAVFPQADLKFFFTADPSERARRRVAEMELAGMKADFNEVLANILERDRIDSSRQIAPLLQAEDAEVLDTGKMTLDEQVNHIIARIRG